MSAEHGLLQDLVSLLLQTRTPIGPMRDRKDYPAELQRAIDFLHGRGRPSATGSVVDGVDVPHAWPQEALDGPKSEPEALVAWLGTAAQFGADETIKIMQRRLDRLEELRAADRNIPQK